MRKLFNFKDKRVNENENQYNSDQSATQYGKKT